MKECLTKTHKTGQQLESFRNILDSTKAEINRLAEAMAPETINKKWQMSEVFKAINLRRLLSSSVKK